MKEIAFRTEKLAKIYGSGDTAVHALRGADLLIPSGDITVLLGHSGSGKSTLVNILGGLDNATSGKAWFLDNELTAMNEKQLTSYRRLHVGFVFQFYNLVPSLTARENVALVTEISKNPMSAQEALDRVGLTPRMNHFPSQLSGGEQQRVAIARAIAKRPNVLLCDEPTGALDSETGITVLEALTQINDELDTTIMIITHNAEIQRIAHKVLFMADGQIIDEKNNKDPVKPSMVKW